MLLVLMYGKPYCREAQTTSQHQGRLIAMLVSHQHHPRALSLTPQCILGMLTELLKELQHLLIGWSLLMQLAPVL